MQQADEISLLGLKGKVALITGGGAGIGRASAELLAQAGCRVVVIEVNPERAALVRHSLGAGHLVIEADAIDAATAPAVMEQIARDFGKLDILVNNLGDFLKIKGPFEHSTEAQWQALYDVNLLHVLRMTQAAIPLMKSGGGGSIINFSTIEAFRGIPEVVVYAAFKSAITGFTQSLAVELGQFGIRVNAVAPETTNSLQITATARVPEENLQHMKRWFPIGRFGEGADSAGAVLYLASDRLSGWVSGSTILVDGGAFAAGSWLRMQDDRWTHLPVIERDGYSPAAPHRKG